MASHGVPTLSPQRLERAAAAARDKPFVRGLMARPGTAPNQSKTLETIIKTSGNFVSSMRSTAPRFRDAKPTAGKRTARRTRQFKTLPAFPANSSTVAVCLGAAHFTYHVFKPLLGVQMARITST